MSDQSHSAVSRAATIVGIRRDHIRLIARDEHFRMDMDALSRTVADDRMAGLNPIAVAANAGTVVTGAIDPLEELAGFRSAEGLWLHVDAAYGGFAAVTERRKELLRGIECADSIGPDALKWFFQPYEAGCLLAKDEMTLKNAFAVRPDILQDTVWGKNHPNCSDLGLQLSRSAGRSGSGCRSRPSGWPGSVVRSRRGVTASFVTAPGCITTEASLRRGSFG